MSFFERTTTILTTLVFSSLAALADTAATIEWDPSPNSTAKGYRVRYGLVSRSYTSMVQVGNVTRLNITGLQPGKRYYFAVSAYDAAGIESLPSNEASTVLAATISLPFWYDFRTAGILSEADSPAASSSAYWWLASGGQMSIANGIATTLPGTHLFQLFLRTKVRDCSLETYVRKTKDNLESAANRYPYNGISLFLRYADDNNHYYAGIRADGYVIIKKKRNGVYYTLAQKKILTGTFNATTSPNLIPSGTWIGLRAAIVNNSSGIPTLSLFTDIGKTGIWKSALEVVDDAALFGASLPNAGTCGMRSDFMNLSLDDFRVSLPVIPFTPASTAGEDPGFPGTTPEIRIENFTHGKPNLSVYGEIGITYAVERSTDLVTWERLTTLVGSAVPVPYRDETATSGKGFYRVVSTN